MNLYFFFDNLNIFRQLFAVILKFLNLDLHCLSKLILAVFATTTSFVAVNNIRLWVKHDVANLLTVTNWFTSALDRQLTLFLDLILNG